MIYCYNDTQGYGRKLYDAVNANKGSANMIGMAAQVPNEPQSIVYINLDGTQAAQDVYYNLCQYEQAKLIPIQRICEMSNNPTKQFLELKKWLPSGWFIHNLRDAMGLIQKIDYPVELTKISNEIAMLTIDSIDVAFKTVAMYFDSKNKMENPSIYVRTIINSGDNEWFVFMLGKKYAFAARINNNSFAMIDSMNEQHNELLKYAYMFMADEDISWASVKVICGADREKKVISPFIDNVYASFPFDWLQSGGMIFEIDNDGNWKSTGKPALRIFDFAAKMINEGTL